MVRQAHHAKEAHARVHVRPDGACQRGLALRQRYEKITGFVGDDKNPKPIREREIKKLTQQVEEGAAPHNS